MKNSTTPTKNNFIDKDIYTKNINYNKEQNNKIKNEKRDISSYLFKQRTRSNSNPSQEKIIKNNKIYIKNKSKNNYENTKENIFPNFSDEIYKFNNFITEPNSVFDEQQNQFLDYNSKNNMNYYRNNQNLKQENYIFSDEPIENKNNSSRGRNNELKNNLNFLNYSYSQSRSGSGIKGKASSEWRKGAENLEYKKNYENYLKKININNSYEYEEKNNKTYRNFKNGKNFCFLF